MMKLRSMRTSAVLLALGLLAGCGGSYSGVQAVAPAEQPKLVGTTPDSGSYTLYKASGYIENQDPNVRPVWTVSLPAGQRIGFRWEADSQDRYNPNGSLHLIAFAGGQTRDLGVFRSRDLQYAWAGSRGDVAGYFSGKGAQKAFDTILMK